MARLLLLEDDRSVSRLLMMVLEMEGHEVTLVEDGAHAIEVLSSAPDAFDAALLDRMVPQRPGIEVCNWIRANEQTRDLPVVMITAMASDLDELEGLAAGADAYVFKPFDPTAVELAVHAVLTTSPDELAASRADAQLRTLA